MTIEGTMRFRRRRDTAAPRSGRRIAVRVVRTAATVAVLGLLVTGFDGGLAAADRAAVTPAIAPTAADAAGPTQARLRVTPVAGGFSHAWDIGVLPDGRALVTERAGRLSLLSSLNPGATVTRLQADQSDVFARGEGGLMGLAVHPDFASSRRFTTCQTHARGGNPVDVRLITWTLSADGRAATRVANPLVSGLPLASTGRHSGCRIAFGHDGAMLVGTGDAARGDLPQNLTSLGGKVLRIDPATGGPARGNPFANAANPAQRLVLTFGHRNVQGMAVQRGTGRVFSAEHGPSVDDEVNVITAGRNYGWDPSRGGTVGGYDESVPMTDLRRFPNAVPAVWRSGSPVEAVAGADFVANPAWGQLNGTLAVAALRGRKLLLMRPDQNGAIVQVSIPAELNGTFGRLRGVRTAPDGTLLVTTSNGTDDRVLRIDPA